MKLTKREKILLIVMASFLLLFLYYRFVFTPQLDEAASMKEKAADFQQKVENVNKQLVSKTKLQSEYKFANAKVRSIMGKYVPEIIQEKLIVALNKMVDASGVEIDNIAYSQIAIADLGGNKGKESASAEENLMDELMKQYGLQTADKTEQKKAADADAPKVLSMKADINFYANYDEALSFLSLLEGYEKRIVIESISLNQAVSQLGSLRGNVGIVFYTLPQLDEEAVKLYNQWDVENPYGRDNPFNPFKGYAGSLGMMPPSGSVKSSALREMNFNFTLAVSPIMSDLPTVFMGRNDISSGTQVYADDQGIEEVELQLMEKDSRYYCRYKAGKTSYPKDYANGWAEFMPIGQSINFHIVSTPRTGTGDKVGVNLNLINKTDLPLRVFIRNDDKASSRINTGRQEGSIYIIKE